MCIRTMRVTQKLRSVWRRNCARSWASSKKSNASSRYSAISFPRRSEGGEGSMPHALEVFLPSVRRLFRARMKTCSIFQGRKADTFPAPIASHSDYAVEERIMVGTNKGTQFDSADLLGSKRAPLGFVPCCANLPQRAIGALHEPPPTRQKALRPPGRTRGRHRRPLC